MDASLLLCVLGLMFANSDGTQNTLKKLQVIFRHGYRYPIHRSWNSSSYTDKQLAELTQLGRSQMSLLGYFLRIHYHSFIGKDNDATQVYYSDYSRDLESAQLASKALFSGYDSKETTPIVLNASVEGVSHPGHSQASWWNSNFQDICNKINKNEGVKCNSATDLSSISDQMICEIAEGISLPSWLDSSVQEELQSVKDAQYATFSKCAGKNYIEDFSDNMLKWMNDIFKPDGQQQNKNIFLYASHDSNIAVILTRMGVFNSLPVPFGAAVFFEQHSINGQSVIRLFYDNSTDYSNFYQLKLPGCDLDCPYDSFVKIVTGSFPCSFAIRPQALGPITILIFVLSIWSFY